VPSPFAACEGFIVLVTFKSEYNIVNSTTTPVSS
jgi:hypothetical protein